MLTAGLAGCQTMGGPVPEPVWLTAGGAPAGAGAAGAANACLEQTRAVAAAGGAPVQVTGALINSGQDYLAALRQDALIVTMQSCMAGRGYRLQGPSGPA
ncbi:hypothetical protein [Pseudoxanthobacter sp.]|uniref:hypothetical protein n=1 Tax=Pseudoxanthobacter sp. TaxID=1925742 RepID=UPI002FE406F7